MSGPQASEGNNGKHDALRIGAYLLLETLGTGSFGKVKLAQHSLTQQFVAIKILNKKKIRSLEMVGKIKREIQILKLFSHPHIIRLYEVISTPTDIFIAMEYVAGGELFEYIVNNGRLSEAEARKFFQQILSGVEYCHRHNVVHRDLKPENLLLDSGHNVKIADFGLSNIMTDGNFLQTSCGSPNYAAPEVISGRLYAGPEVDVWSCGVILYALLCGKLPFDDEYIPVLFKKIKSGHFVIPPYISPKVRELLHAMLQVDPLKRATIFWIRQTEWFLVDLPPYLMSDYKYAKATIDHAVVNIVAEKMSSTSDEVNRALQPNASPNDPLLIAYHLIYNSRSNYLTGKTASTHLLQDTSSSSSSISSSLSPVSSESTSRNSSILTLNRLKISPPLDDPSSPAAILAPSPLNPCPTPILDHHLHHHHKEVLGIEELPVIGNLYSDYLEGHESHLAYKTTYNLVHQARGTSKWHLGIRSRSQPSDVMYEVYRAMRRLNLVWRTLNPYHVICKLQGTDDTARTMKLGLQLYKVDDRHYLLDFRNLAIPENGELGSITMGFFEICSVLIKELAVPSSK